MQTQIDSLEQQFVDVTFQEASDTIQCKKDFYDGLTLLDFALPAYSQPLVTMEWLTKVRKKKVYCPKFGELKIRRIVVQVTKAELAKAINEAC